MLPTFLRERQTCVCESNSERLHESAIVRLFYLNHFMETINHKFNLVCQDELNILNAVYNATLF